MEAQIKAQDLRIGNWVWNEVQNIPVRVDIRVLQDQIYADKGVKPSWEPIPLTEEILLKCGFDVKSISYHAFLNNIILCLHNDVWKYKFTGTDIPYVHQLQNLYHALTGQELNIEL